MQVAPESRTAFKPRQTAAGTDHGAGWLIFEEFRQSVVDQAGDEGASLLLWRVAFDDQVDPGQHLGVAQDLVDVNRERGLIGEKRRPLAWPARSRARSRR